SRADEQRSCAPSISEGGPEVVPDQRERAEAENRVGVARSSTECVLEGGVRARQVRRVPGLAPPELVRVPELDERVGVVGPSTDGLLEPAHLRAGEARAPRRERPLSERSPFDRRAAPPPPGLRPAPPHRP